MTEVKKNPTTPEIVSLKILCKEVNIDPKEARLRLRHAVKTEKTRYPALSREREARQPWSWTKGSEAHLEAKKAVSECSIPIKAKAINKTK